MPGSNHATSEALRPPLTAVTGIWGAAVLLLMAALFANPAKAVQALQDEDSFRILASELIVDIDRQKARYGLPEEPTIAVWPEALGDSPLPQHQVSEINDRLLTQLLEIGGSRYRFVARDALDAVARDSLESGSGQRTMNEILAALAEGARADLLIVSRIGSDREGRILVSFRAVDVARATIVAASSRRALDQSVVAAEAMPPPVDQADFEEEYEEEVAAPPSPAPEQPVFEDPWEEPEFDDRQRLQGLLTALGYAPGRHDGVIDRRSRRAIRQYQQDHGLYPDGRYSEPLLAHMFGQAKRRLAQNPERGWEMGPRDTGRPYQRTDYLQRPYQSGAYPEEEITWEEKSYRGEFCRSYWKQTTIAGRQQSVRGTACRQPDGSWQLAGP